MQSKGLWNLLGFQYLPPNNYFWFTLVISVLGRETAMYFLEQNLKLKFFLITTYPSVTHIPSQRLFSNTIWKKHVPFIINKTWKLPKSPSRTEWRNCGLQLNTYTVEYDIAMRINENKWIKLHATVSQKHNIEQEARHKRIHVVWDSFHKKHTQSLLAVRRELKGLGGSGWRLGTSGC